MTFKMTCEDFATNIKLELKAFRDFVTATGDAKQALNDLREALKNPKLLPKARKHFNQLHFWKMFSVTQSGDSRS